ncbi:hypothetical protein SLEP1_g18630 [Rubroshorea leprosula]|uniref:Uncharacterized protein n=1 Tax=Rubroshorea leprosula TaxID=152421 RepID=A0AAV5JA01_9ROSI|nr:hypothetical protein SLEP1_g18630 [Rubroshorea leprosula]
MWLLSYTCGHHVCNGVHCTRFFPLVPASPQKKKNLEQELWVSKLGTRFPNPELGSSGGTQIGFELGSSGGTIEKPNSGFLVVRNPDWGPHNPTLGSARNPEGSSWVPPKEPDSGFLVVRNPDRVRAEFLRRNPIWVPQEEPMRNPTLGSSS